MSARGRCGNCNGRASRGPDEMKWQNRLEREVVQEEWYREVPLTEPRMQCTVYGAKGRNLDSRRLARRVDSRDGVHKSGTGYFRESMGAQS